MEKNNLFSITFTPAAFIEYENLWLAAKEAGHSTFVHKGSLNQVNSNLVIETFGPIFEREKKVKDVCVSPNRNGYSVTINYTK